MLPPRDSRNSSQVGAKRAPRAKLAKDNETVSSASSERIENQPVSAVVTPSAGGAIVPIALRADLTVHVQGLPFDLSEREAKKIANVILAMAMDNE